jgi:transposase
VFLKSTSKTVKGKTYSNHLLVESVHTPNGPRHRVICSLGSLAPAPAEDWLALAHKLQDALSGQATLLPDAEVQPLIVRAQRNPSRSRPRQTVDSGEVVPVLTGQITIEDARTAGAVHVGHQIWHRLGLDAILKKIGLDDKPRLLTEVMTLNRLICPASEHAMPDWIRRTAISDILQTDFDFSSLNDENLYRNLDKLHPWRVEIEKDLADKERTLFRLDESIYFYDLTSTYFEGNCERNPKARRGYSRDGRPDCKQVVIGLVLDGDGFPKAHEVFDGNRVDTTTVDDMLAALEKRMGSKPGATVVVDRGMSSKKNLKQIAARGYFWLVAAQHGQRSDHLEEYVSGAGWETIERIPTLTNPAQKKSRVQVKRSAVNGEVHVLCLSDDRIRKDRAIRETHEKRLLADLEKLRIRIQKKRLKGEVAVGQAIGRLRQRHSRVARFYQIDYDHPGQRLNWTELVERKQQAEQLDGAYMLKTNRQDLSDEEIWRTYTLLTRVESAFRAIKSPLQERPVFHQMIRQIERRVETHIFLCVLAYHLLVSIEHTLRKQNIHTSWESLRDILSTHQIVTVRLPTVSGRILSIRKPTTPEPLHKTIYQALGIPETAAKTVKAWEAQM